MMYVMGIMFLIALGLGVRRGIQRAATGEAVRSQVQPTRPRSNHRTKASEPPADSAEWRSYFTFDEGVMGDDSPGTDKVA